MAQSLVDIRLDFCYVLGREVLCFCFSEEIIFENLRLYIERRVPCDHIESWYNFNRLWRSARRNELDIYEYEAIRFIFIVLFSV